MLKHAKIQPQSSGDLVSRDEEVDIAVKSVRNGPELMARSINHPAVFGSV
ncbi:MAG: hypothetical protein ACQER3_06775 [Pseudomonadota bacterium]|nr:hypothetical protein [Serratia fonticola]MBC3252303.1 hypothetical protein [Serratia fonticola]